MKKFIQEFEKEQKDLGLKSSDLLNMDETGVWFQMASRRTISIRGEAITRVATGGQDKSRLTVVLCCTADGQKIPPALIFKGKPGKRLEERLQQSDRDGFPEGVYIYYQGMKQ